MNMKSFRVAAVALALAATAGCGKKAPKEIPPPAIDTSEAGTEAETGGSQSGDVGTEGLPGSRGDFLRTVGMTGDRIFFDTDQYSLDDRDRAALDAQAAWLARYTAVQVTIEGHADERGTREYNLALGDRRANAAKNYLAARGVSPSRMTVISYGKERPEALGSDEASWAQNRRSVTVVPQ